MPVVKCQAKDPATCRVHGTAVATALKMQIEITHEKIEKIGTAQVTKSVTAIQKMWESLNPLFADLADAEQAYYATEAGYQELEAEYEANKDNPKQRKVLANKLEKARLRAEIEEKEAAANPPRARATIEALGVDLVKPEEDINTLGIPGAHRIDRFFQLVSQLNGEPIGYLYRRQAGGTTYDWGTTENLQEAKSGINWIRQSRVQAAQRIINERAKHDKILIDRSFDEVFNRDTFNNDAAYQRARDNWATAILSNGYELKNLRDNGTR